MGQRLGVGLGAPPLLARHDQSGALDDLADGAGGRPRAARLIALQNPLQLARSPRHMRLAQSQYRSFDLLRCLVGVMQPAPVQFHQSADSMLAKTTQPHIARIARDPVTAAKFAHRLLIALIIKHKAQLLFHYTARFPGHEDVLPVLTPRCSVSDDPGSICQQSARSVPQGYPPSPPSIKNLGLNSPGS